MTQQDPTLSPYNGAGGGGVGAVGGLPSVMSVPGELVSVHPQVPAQYVPQQQQQAVDPNQPNPGQFVSSPLSVPPPSSSFPPSTNPYGGVAADAMPPQPLAPAVLQDDATKNPAGPPPPQAPPSIDGPASPTPYKAPERDTPPPDSGCKKFGRMTILCALFFLLFILGLVGIGCAAAAAITLQLSRIRYFHVKAKGGARFVIFVFLVHLAVSIVGWILKAIFHLLKCIAIGCYLTCDFALGAKREWQDKLRAKRAAWDDRLTDTPPPPDAPPAPAAPAPAQPQAAAGGVV